MTRKQFENAVMRAKSLRLCMTLDYYDRHLDECPACCREPKRIVAEAIEKARGAK